MQIASRLPRAPAVGVVAVTLALFGLPTFYDSVRHDRLYAQKYTMTRALEWIESYVPPGTRVLLEGNPEMDAALIVPLGNTRENLRRIAAEIEDRDPGKARFLRMKARVFEGPGYDLVTVRHFEAYEPWASYRADGVELVVRAGPPAPETEAANAVAASRARLDRELAADPSVRLVATFDPGELGAPGRYLRLYRVLDRSARVD
jgi:hypothetical protein